MSNLIITVLTAIVSFLTAIVNKLTVDVELEIVDVELESFPLTVFSFDALDAIIAARWTIDTSVEVVEVTEVNNLDDAAILAALGLATPVVETFEEVAVVAPVVETVEVSGVVYTITHMVDVDVSFSGRSISKFRNVEGYLFQGSNGTSDFLIRVQAPLNMANAKEWMSRNCDVRIFSTKVVVTPTTQR
jgi:hypothetical protein